MNIADAQYIRIRHGVLLAMDRHSILSKIVPIVNEIHIYILSLTALQMDNREIF